jgi:hypothetical protein
MAEGAMGRNAKWRAGSVHPVRHVALSFGSRGARPSESLRHDYFTTIIFFTSGTPSTSSL